MRKTHLFFLLFILCSAILGGCELTDDGSYAAPITNYEKIAGTWSLTDIKQIDEIAKANSAEPDEVQLITKFGFSDFQIKLNVDESFLPTAFEVTGDAPNLFLQNGYWELDKPFAHADGTSTQILLYADAEKTNVINRLSITAVPGAVENLEFKLAHTTGQTPYASYVYKLSPVN